ncbi:MAG: glutathione S-transferase, partial [Candidatus Omnitrophica bacterium]|nr:glutathione S-transferase [Candidatus Omnitrophota bacterium]
DHLKPKPTLIPQNPVKRLDVLTLAAAADGLMDVTVAMFMEKKRHPEDSSTAFINAQEETIRRCLAYFDGKVDQFKQLNIASVALASAIGYLRFRMPHLWSPSNAARLARWYEEISKRKSMQETAPKE